MIFNEDECYCLLLAMDLFCEEYNPATAGESGHLDKAVAVRDRVRSWYDMRRRQYGNSPVYSRMEK